MQEARSSVHPTAPSSSLRLVLQKFVSHQAAGGVLLMVVTVVALGIANSGLAAHYFVTLEADLLGLSVLDWVNDALMAVFFLLVGLEIKREMVLGELKTWPDRALPGISALGGMVVPALIYVAFNFSTPDTLRGWAIPSATDIAFSLGVLALLGSRVPPSLKIFLTALAILDDLGAVVIIAFFYTSQLHWPYLLGAAALLALLYALNRAGVERLAVYLALGIVLWVLVLKSGVHATLAGVALAMTLPIHTRGPQGAARETPLVRLEHGLQPWVAYLVVPVFGFANAGVSFKGITPSALMAAVPLGIALGLFIGKQVGIFVFAWGAIRSKIAVMPANATKTQLYGVALLCGIGFTMSLFIGLLAFQSSPHLQDSVKLGVLCGSFLSAVAGALLLSIAKPAAESRVQPG